MKKLMLGLAIAAVGSAFAIESSNVVGYMAATNGALGQYTGGGSMFVTPGQGTYKLSSFSINGFTPNTKAIAKAQYIQFLQPSSCRVDDERAYYYWSGKWYYKYTSGSVVADTEAADFTIPAGTGFMCNFGKAGSKLNYAGEVLENSEGLAVASDGAQYFFAYNPYPVAVKLTDLSISGYTPATKAIAKAQYVQFLLPGSCRVDDARAYYNWSGKWYYKYTSGTAVADAEVTDFYIQPGEGFMCNFGRATSKLNFPKFELK